MIVLIFAFRDVSILTVETIAICKALKMVTDRNMDKVLIENDSQIVINSIKGLLKISS